MDDRYRYIDGGWALIFVDYYFSLRIIWLGRRADIENQSFFSSCLFVVTASESHHEVDRFNFC